ncbi:PstS family phosphate ABC transporter substrate-binding protein [Kribbella sp.]|uniref:PstS family phosphate ABC transporter substrate-binding protein n=1 Tax=Kribbella sp. TaxID=1871183 RepID=UPI002D4A0729|nr:substrate-binding domain-containing protein [Kribbella sp.]HZX06693.1 substrate-binding domain-containing protein [Kribbella sp.]
MFDFSGLGNIDLGTVIALVSLVGTSIVWLLDRYVWRRKRLVYRVQVDAQIGVHPRQGQARDLVDVEVRHQNEVVEDPSIVLLRVDNTGTDIDPGDMQGELEFGFPDRKIVRMKVVESHPPKLGTLIEKSLEPAAYVDKDTLVVPRFGINHGDHFKFLLVLSGLGKTVTHDGYLTGGANGGVYHEPRPRGPGRRTLIFGATTLVLVGALVAFFLVDVLRPPDNCAAGQIRVIGSTAVEPTMTELRSAYASQCSGADIMIAANGSRSGVLDLKTLGAQDPGAASKVIAMSDGPAEDAPDLSGEAIAVVVFAVVVNRSSGVTSLTTDELRKIYTGKITNWNQVGGKNLPIRMVSRVGPASGSRLVFREKVLGGDRELGITSDNCRQDDNAVRASYHRCEVGTTDELLTRVNEIDGAIGYAELGSARKFPDLAAVTIDDVVPDTSKVADRSYTFWEVEHAYTYKAPEAKSLTAAFLDYVRSSQARPVLERGGLVPCAALPTGFCG